ncbi:pentapeptide repeat-containing protein [Amycolatopsis pithecellobii]|uniref:pentapeptide repeat-containing protein n=1 Tax=Amycolatopsis pithecellobii TaxID=664692 RepID=UPI0028B14846|nr:pentapeptide repeat-containing protein [Amycolatopsis pithecellobii]
MIDLRDTCLAGIRATGADLSGISLVGSDLHDADLPKVHGNLIGLSKITLTNANLYGADLSGYVAGFTDADLTGATHDSCTKTTGATHDTTTTGAWW